MHVQHEEQELPATATVALGPERRVTVRHLKGHLNMAAADGAGGPTLLMLHGAGDDHRAWDQLMPLLPGHERVAVALPGRSGSSGPPLQSVADAAALVRRVADALSLGDVVAVGHSMGGAIALELAVGGWDRLVGVALLATGARLRVHPMIMEAMRALVDGRLTRAQTGGFWKRGTDPALIARVEARMAETPPAIMLADWEMANAFDRMSDLDRVRCPALVAVGDQDVLTPPKYARFMAERLSDARLVTLEGAGHLFPIEEPARIATPLQAFLAG